jgi:hypothetical protein
MSNEISNIYGNTSAPVKSTTTEMMVSRQAQEVQAAMVIAKKFPRDEVGAFNRIMRACQRRSLAEQAEYEYPRGGTKVSGPSIRLAEALAQNWGNIDYGVIELEQKESSSEMMAYAWDLETNTRATRIFSVKHQRDTKKGSHALTDSRDIYEITANFGARRVRACILEVIPGDVVEAAQQQCNLTLTNGNTEPLIDRIRKMVKAFEDEFSVTKTMLEEYIGCNSDVFSENDFVRLRKVYRSLKDGMAKREDYFNIGNNEKSPFETDKGKDKKDAKKSSGNNSQVSFAGTPFDVKEDDK